MDVYNSSVLYRIQLGKSHLLRVAAITYCLSAPGIQVYLFRKQLTDLIKGHLSSESGFPSLLLQLTQAKVCKIDMARYQIKFRNGGPKHNSYAGGSCIHLCHLTKGAKSLNIYQGAEIHVLMLDESTHFLASSYKFLRTRLRLGGWHCPETGPYSGNYFPRILACTNPGGVSHSYWKEQFVDNAPTYTVKKMPPELGGMNRMYIKALVSDNEILMRTDPLYVQRLQASGNKATVRALLFADWNISEGGLFEGSFDFDKHVLPQFKIPTNWKVTLCGDWGASKPFGFLYFAESNGEAVELADGTLAYFPAGTAICMHELYGCKEGEYDVGINISDIDIGKRIRETEEVFLKGYQITPGASDGHMWGKQNREFSIIEDIMLGYFGRRNNNPEALLKRYKKPAHSRVEGFRLIKNKLRNSDPFMEGGSMEHAGFFIMDNCKHLLRTLPTLPRNPNNPDDSDPNAEDHLSDVVNNLPCFIVI